MESKVNIRKVLNIERDNNLFGIFQFSPSTHCNILFALFSLLSDHDIIIYILNVQDFVCNGRNVFNTMFFIITILY